jgi:hypothetical protein
MQSNILNNSGNLSESDLSFTSTARQEKILLCMNVSSMSRFPQQSNVSIVLRWHFESQTYYLNNDFSAFAWLVFFRTLPCRMLCVPGKGNMAFAAANTVLRIYCVGRSDYKPSRDNSEKGKLFEALKRVLFFIGRPHFSQHPHYFPHTKLTVLPWREFASTKCCGHLPACFVILGDMCIFACCLIGVRATG